MTTDNYMTLKVMDGKVVTNSFKIDHANDKVLPTDNTQVSLFYPNLDLDVDFTGYTVYVGEYDIYRVSKPSSGYVVTNPVGSFVKGRITEVRNDMGMVTAIDNGKFYVATKNAALADVLVPNAEVKCEYSLNGNWSDVTNAIGFGARLVQDGQLLTQGDSSVAPRTMLGVRADGSYVFMTVDGRQETKGAFGISYVEGGALLQQLDCVQGFNLDGGGSTISIIRDANGELQVMNWPSDGNERSLGNTILVVKRDPKIAITEVGTTTIKVAQLGEVVDGTIRNVQVKVYGGEYQMMTGNEFTFTDLDRDSDYIILYKYEIVDDFGRVIRSAENKLVTTTFGAGVPEIDKFRVSTKSGTSITFDYEITTDEVTDIQQKYIVYGQDQRKFDLDDLSGKATISDLTAGTEYEFKLVIEYALAGTDRTVVSQAYTYKPAAAVSTGCPTGANVTALYLTFVSFAAAGVFLVLRKRG
jgi:hypothetical protein